ncbi:RNase adapter RapZ [Neomoorella humiferrea]|uniref:GlmZ(SRNA)-inactivating NTPase n=1 Tax=Neomoorella humiferrea TaxID=676965 RepID=A0A2T0AZ14_9FIRM|nr:RNase adapter RapZ [Moorella humiferrea]PRR76231.1 glmZ(sRNA)-inactivating NTPase [Moorella humiferrea]
MTENAYPRLVIVTGLSGAGKTQAARCLEDLGFFCVDNLPPSLIPGLVDLLRQPAKNGKGIDKVALVMDIRGGQFFDDLEEALAYLDSRGIPYEILFLEAADEVLVRRYKETRRRHPLSSGGQILEGIIAERRRLEELRGRATKIIDTSELTPRQLKEQVAELFGDSRRQLKISIISFGYKYGIPLDADLVMDVRFLPNPYYNPALRPFTGHDRCVADFVMASPEAQEFIAKFAALLRFLIPQYQLEGKSHLVIAIGCTGGQHRSVTLANKLGEILRGDSYDVVVKHRDLIRYLSGGRR